MAKKRLPKQLQPSKLRKPECIPSSFGALREATVEELANEISKRSLGMIVVAMSADEGNEEQWDVWLKGSPAMLSLLYQAAGFNLTQGSEKA